MANDEFLTVPQELESYTGPLVSYFRGYGFTVHPEKSALDFPFTPTLFCKHPPTSLFVELSSSVPMARLRTWVAYAHSCKADTQVALAIPENAHCSPEDRAELAAMRVGLYIVGAGVTEERPPADLAIGIGLPDLTAYPQRVRRALGPSFQMIERGNWREGFEGVCVSLETAARKYLIKSLDNGRIRLVNPSGNVRNKTAVQIEKMPMGALKDEFEFIQNPNVLDQQVAAALKRINPDRVRVAHKKRIPRVETILRNNYGRQVWASIGVLDGLLKP